MKRSRKVYGKILTEPQEIATAAELWERVVLVSRPASADWQVMRELKALFDIHSTGAWPYLHYLVEELLGRAKRRRIMLAKDLKVGQKVWYIPRPGQQPVACEIIPYAAKSETSSNS
jgi:hypothetical protein